MAKPDTATIERLYHSMLLIRRVEEHICDVYASDAIKSPVHLSIGQESVAVGLCDVLRKDDMVSNTYRCHATHIAKGGNLRQMMAELYGKATGCAQGKAGSMHLIDIPAGVMGASAVVGTTIPVAMGYAQAMQWDALKGKNKRVMMAVCGDGATEEGVFSESLNYAALKKLPMVFVVENNGFAIHTPIHRRQPNWSLRDRVATYGIPTQVIEDGDVFAIRDAAAKAIEAARSGAGAQFIECKTYRWMEHVGPTDDHDHGPYRNLKDYEQWKANDQIIRLEKMLGAAAEKVKTKVEAELKDAVDFAIASPYPDNNQLSTFVYAA
jgi:TPP-dependent pyruvate/acetoin dehydrogenase alpha subunit